MYFQYLYALIYDAFAYYILKAKQNERCKRLFTRYGGLCTVLYAIWIVYVWVCVF